MALNVAALDSVTSAVISGLNKAGLLVLESAKSNCPVDTGNLRRSITLESASVSNPKVTVLTNVDYAEYVEAGTSKSPAQPFMQPALEQNKAGILNCLTNLI